MELSRLDQSVVFIFRVHLQLMTPFPSSRVSFASFLVLNWWRRPRWWISHESRVFLLSSPSRTSLSVDANVSRFQSVCNLSQSQLSPVTAFIFIRKPPALAVRNYFPYVDAHLFFFHSFRSCVITFRLQKPSIIIRPRSAFTSGPLFSAVPFSALCLCSFQI